MLGNDATIGIYVVGNAGSGVTVMPVKHADERVVLIDVINLASLVIDESRFREVGIGDITSW